MSKFSQGSFLREYFKPACDSIRRRARSSRFDREYREKCMDFGAHVKWAALGACEDLENFASDIRVEGARIPKKFAATLVNFSDEHSLACKIQRPKAREVSLARDASQTWVIKV